jgi:hypothetical protein
MPFGPIGSGCDDLSFKKNLLITVELYDPVAFVVAYDLASRARRSK